MTLESRHNKAQRYMAKQKLIGRIQLEFMCMPNDRVWLTKVNEIPGVTKVRIPDFITDIPSLCNPFEGTVYSEIEIDNSPDLDISLNLLCRGMAQNTLKIRIEHPERVTQTKEMFSSQKLREIYLENFKLTNCKNLKGMFKRCVELTKIRLGDLEAPKAEDISGMFYDCCNLTEIDLQSLGSIQPRNMSELFSKCYSLVSVELGSIDTQLCQSMAYMFEKCMSLRNLDLQHFKTPRLVNASGMFQYCTAIRNINLSNFTQENLMYLSWAFQDCPKLKCLDVQNLEYRQNINTQNMLHNQNKQMKIIQSSDEFKALLERRR